MPATRIARAINLVRESNPRTPNFFNVPMILTTVLEGHGGPIIKGTQDVDPDPRTIGRTTISAREGPKLADVVKKSGRKQVDIAALWTEICLAMPMIHALGEGYR